jgi:ABC-type nitrate/sulfonate/bicarbonate transport system substrate-binding protein
MGRHVSVYGTEYDVAPGLLTYGVCVSDSGDLNELDPQQARALAEQLLEAAAWVEANQET